MGDAHYTDLLTDLISEAKAAGLEAEASELESACFGVAFTTSSELLGENGIALGPSGIQPPACGARGPPPSLGAAVDAFRPAWASCTAGTAPCSLRKEVIG